MENLKDELRKIIEIVMGMEFNEAAYHRKYSGIKPPMKRMFTPEAIEKAVATLFLTSGLNNISKRGYASVVEQVLLSNSCRPLASASPGEKSASGSWISLPVKPAYPRNKKRKAPEEPLLLCYKEARKLQEPEDGEEPEPPEPQALQAEEKKMEDEELPELELDNDDAEEYVDIADIDVEEMEIDREDGSNELSVDPDPVVEEFCLVADDVGDLKAEELRELVQGLSSDDLELVPDGSPLVKEARRAGNQVFLSFTSVLLAELVLDAFSGEKTIRGVRLALRRGYSRKLEFLAGSFSMQTLILARLVYVSGLSKESGESEIAGFQAMLEDVRGMHSSPSPSPSPSPIKSMLVLPGKREMVLELSADLQADLLMYRSESRIAKELLVCRSRSLVPRVIRCPASDVSPPAPLPAADALKRDVLVSTDAQKRDVLVVADAQEPGSLAAADGHKLDMLATTAETRLPPKPLRSPELPPGFEKRRADPEKASSPQKKRELAIVPAEGMNPPHPVFRDNFCQRTLFVKGLKPGYNVHRLRAFFPGAIAACGQEDWASLEFDSQAAADSVMDAYVERPQEFFSEEFALLIVRSPRYVRPGQVIKRNERLPCQWPGRVLVTGISSALPENVVRGALAELLDRELAREPSVTECGANLLRESHRKGELFVLTFFTRAAVRALVSLGRPLRFAGRTISFSLEGDGNVERGGDGDGDDPWQRQLVVLNPGSRLDPSKLRSFIRGMLPPDDDLCLVETVSSSVMVLTLGSESAADWIMDAYVGEPNAFRFGSSGLSIFRDRDYVRPGSGGAGCRRPPGKEFSKPAVLLARNFPTVKQQMLCGVLCELLCRALRGNPRIRREGLDFVRDFVPVKNRNQEYLVTLYSWEAAQAVLALEKPVVISGKVIRFSLPVGNDNHRVRSSIFDRLDHRET